ncbi:SH3 domain-containing protein [Aquimarina sp. MMG016]|uniref:SH3 domain-containing protein n=1 Tax=Aquimarina sp. MMG016 TaxID=2822690 RepID=UPI001B3A2A8F|nr:SH3 domain-containing protein [Aquimarina sp. MMG016]MBQ4822561.1 SH3 domain-containing protein [Aquimarina sp. MMG016]
MKKALALFIFMINNCISFSQQNETRYISEHFSFKEGSTEYLFGNNVKLRSEPNTTSKAIDLLSIGSKIVILSKEEEFMQFEGLKSHWYKVNYKDKIGYILGALIASKKLSYNDVNFYFNIKKDAENLQIKIRNLQKGKNYIEANFNLIGREFEAKLSNNKGISEVSNIITIDYLSEACGIQGGKSYVFWDGTQFHHVADLSQISEAGIFYFSEEFIFPDEENGVPGKVYYVKEQGETIDETTGWTKTTIEKKEFSWSQNKLTPSLRTK